MATTIGEGKFLRLVRDGEWEFVERSNARGVVAVAALTAKRQIILTEQFRPAVGARVIDLPAGLAGDIQGSEDEELTESAARELTEETGYNGKRLVHLVNFPTSPGLTSEIVAIFLARNVRQVSEGGGVEGEAIQVHIRPLRGIDRWLERQADEGKLIDGKIYSALYLLKRDSRRRS